jgi:hypothetical protein
MRVEPNRFRYVADPVCITALVLYCCNRWIIKPMAGGGFSADYLNDVLCLPLFLPPILWVQKRLNLRPGDHRPRLWEVLQHWAVFSVVFELVVPRLPGFRSTADAWDVVAYLAGGLAAYFFWRRPRKPNPIPPAAVSDAASLDRRVPV